MKINQKWRNETKGDIIKNKRNLFTLEKETKTIKDKIINDIKNHFEQEKGYYKPIRVGNFYICNYIEYESNGAEDENVLIEDYLNETKPYLKDTIIDL